MATARLLAPRPSALVALLAAFCIGGGGGGCGGACGGSGDDSAPDVVASGSSSAAAPRVAGTATGSAIAASAEPQSVPAAAATDIPLVSLDGSSRPLPPLPEDAPRLAARAMLVAVHERPTESSRKVGWLRAGAVVAMRSEASAGGEGCPGGWRAIEPAGFVCVGERVTLDLADPIVRATTRRPDHTQKLPYMYGTVTRGGPAYARIPQDEDLATHEPGLRKHIAKWKDDEESGATYGLDVWAKWSKDPLPPALDAWEAKTTEPRAAIPFYLADGGRVPDLSGLLKKDRKAVKLDQVDRRQGIAFLETFLHQGRRYNVATDLRLVPADRLRPIRGSENRGVRIGVDVKMPFALVRRAGGKRVVLGEKGEKGAKPRDLAYRSAVQLTGKQTFIKDVLHFETAEGDWVSDRYASRIDPAKKMPKWGKNGEKWLDVNITKQVLVAYEGETPVFAALVSTGEAGLADHEGSTATKKGIFRIHTKYVTTTMDSDTVGEEFELRDVPYVQYFEGGYALHGAYWHDRFGQPKSHGCINLAPEDARRIFHWTEPQVPAGWHGAARALTGTVVFVHP